uniref:Uncharacterized protein n=1 Tax=Brassica oleracea TaxID=3712 RepID=A0A3P6BDI1_BRAOL|nr:unnamed protein product [Brassica oleracea]
MEMPELPRRIYTLGEEPPALGFDWASRLIHYMLEFENLTGLNCEYIEDLERPHSAIIASLERCEGWSRDDRKRLADISVVTLLMGFMQALRVRVYTALPELGATFGSQRT